MPARLTNPDLPIIHVDFETRSKASLKDLGVWAYSLDETTDVWCMAYAYESHPVEVWQPGDPMPSCFNSPFILAAHNYRFEQAIYHNIMACSYGFKLMPETYRCTMALAMRLNLPAALDDLASRLGLREQKDAEGKKLMTKMANASRYNPEKLGSTAHKNYPEDIKRLVEYCKQDVEVERAVWDRFQFAPMDWDEFELDRRINDRGMKVDKQTAAAIGRTVKQKQKEMMDRVPVITLGGLDSVTKVKKTLEYLQTQGYPAKNLQAETIRDTLEANRNDEIDLTEEAVQILHIRQKSSLGSLAKFDVMARASDSSDRMRGLFQLYGASQTGRWAGRLVQFQNLPRMDLDDETIDQLIGYFREGNIAAIESFGEDVFHIAKKLIRPMFIASRHHTLVVSDLAQIECRTLAWLAGCKSLLDQFSDSDVDPYAEMAAAIYNKPASQCGKGTEERQVGKCAVLGCGYGMGGETFMATVRSQVGMDISRQQADHIVNTYRTKYPEIRHYWNELDTAFGLVLNDPRNRTRIVGACDICQLSADTTAIILPSGRSLLYYQLKSDGGEKSFLSAAGGRVKIYGGKIAENITQAVARDIQIAAMFGLENAGFRVVGHVHDEVILEVVNHMVDIPKIDQIMSTSPCWAKDLPIAAETAKCKRYTK